MDSDHSAPEFSSNVSDQSGSVPSSNALEGSGEEVLTQKPPAGVMEVGNKEDASVSFNVNGGGGGGEGSEKDDGFESGDEEFETPLARGIRVYYDEKSSEGEAVHAPFVNYSEEFFTPKAGRGIPEVSVVNDDEERGVGGSGGNDLGSHIQEQGGGGGDSNLAEEGTAEKFGIGATTEEYQEDAVRTEPIKESGVSDGQEVFVEDSGGIDNKGSESGKVEGSMHDVVEGEMVAEQNGVESHNLEDDEAVKEQNLYDTPQAIPVEADSGAQPVTEGDANVDTIQVDLLPSGVAVVGDKEEIDESEIKGMEAPSGVSLENGFEAIEGDTDNGAEPVIAEVKDEEVVKEHDREQAIPVEADSGAQVVAAGDSVVDAVQVNVLPSGVAVVGDKEDIDTSEIQGMEAPVGVSLENGFEAIEGDTEEPLDKVETLDAKSDSNVDDDDTKHADKGMHTASQENADFESHSVETEVKALQDDINVEDLANEGDTRSHVEASGDSPASEYVDPNSSSSREMRQEEDDEVKFHSGSREIDGSVSDEDAEGMIFGSSEAARRFMEELEQQSGADGSQDPSQRIDGQIVTDSDEEVDTDEEGDGKELFDSAALAALLKAATGAGQDGGNITITSQDGSRLFSVERPAGLGPSLQSVKPTARPNRVSLFSPSNPRAGAESDSNLSEEEKKKLEKVQQIRIKFLRLVRRLGFTPEESMVAQILYRLTLVAGRQSSPLFSLEDAKRSASQLEAEGRDDLEFSLNILVIGKTGVGKSATINSIFGETKTSINAYGPATTAVTEVVGMVDGVKIRVFDTPGLKSSAVEQNFNRKVLSTVKKFTKKSPPDIVLYVDRLDTQTRNLNDLPLLKSITNVLGSSIWQNAIVTLTHAASAPPDGPSGSPLGYDVFVAQRSHIVQQTIGQAVGDLRLMNPSLMNPVSLVENHPSCRKNRDGEKILPNGQSWRSQLLILCYSMKILSEAGNLSKTQDKLDQRKLFGFRVRSPPLPYLLSWLLQSRTHPKLSADQGGDNGDSDIELADLSDSDIDEDEDEYDQLPPFKPLKKSQIAKLSREQSKAYFEEYEYRVKLLQKKQWREELKRMREMKKKGKATVNDYNYMEEEDQENGAPAAVPVPLPDMVLPPSFDCDNPAYRYRFLEPTSQLLTRPVLDTHGWDHDCGYDGVNLEQSLAIINKFPAAVTVQITKDKKDFSIHLDSSVAAKHGENGSTMAGFDIQNIGKQLAYIFRGDTKFKNFKRNKTAAGVSVTFLGENVSTGLKVEDQIALGKRLVLVGSTGTVRSQGDSAYGANFEVRLREADFPIGQDQSSLGLSLVKWRGDLALGANFQSQFSVGRSYKMAVRAGLNNKLSGQITVRTSSSDQLQIALVAILPIARAIYKNFWPGARENFSIY